MTEKTSLMTQWVIYYNTSDYPGKYVVRKCHIFADGLNLHGEGIVTNTLDEARSVIPLGLHRIQRYDEDDPVIVETWILKIYKILRGLNER